MQVIIKTEHADMRNVEDLANLVAIIDRFGVCVSFEGTAGVKEFFARELELRGVKTWSHQHSSGD